MKSVFVLVAALGMAQSPVFRSDTRAVEVTVVATRADGSAVTDLRKDEMRVFDKDREQSIASFERIGGPSTAGTVAASRPPQRSIIVLDALNTFCGDQIYGREAVSKVLEKLTPGTERIAIFALGDKFQLLHDFSMDTASLRKTVGDYEGERPFFGVDMDSVYTKPPPPPCDIFRQGPSVSDPAIAFRQEERLSSTLDALKSIARRMKSVQGEKSLLWITDGFPPPVYHRGIESVAAELADAKVKLLPVDARGVAAGLLNIQAMEELAEQTGGRVYAYNNDTAALVQAALDDTKEGYLLTFSPKGYQEDGSVHELRLRTSRKGIELRYRPSYVASPN